MSHFHHRERCQPQSEWRAKRALRHALKWKIFSAMAGSILVSAVLSLGIARWFGSQGVFERRLASVEDYFAEEYARVWHSKRERRELSERLRRAFGAEIALLSVTGDPLPDEPNSCPKADFQFDVPSKGSPLLGRVSICFAHRFQGPPLALWLALVLSVSVLWFGASILSRRLARPLLELTRVTRELGEGNLKSRVRLDLHRAGEVGELSESIHLLATRIEQQLADQRELLASVSHEIRTPLARIAVIAELLETQPRGELLSDLQREVREIDDLTGQLLASARLDFGSLDATPIDLRELCETTLRRANLPANLLRMPKATLRAYGDPTLVGRALLNLLENGKTHGQGVKELLVEERSGLAALIVIDEGPGLEPALEGRVFEPFVRGRSSGKSSGSLGLGLSLVARIARAQGGQVWAQNEPSGGAQVGFSVPLERARDKAPA